MRLPALLLRSASAACLVAVVGCDQLGLTPEVTEDLRPFDVALQVASDPGKPLKNAEIIVDEKVVASTDDAGAAKLTFTGKEGDIVEVSVKCPVGHDAPPAIAVSLRRMAQGSRPPTYDVKCTPRVRTVVVGIRTENGNGLPVVYLGRTVARTDASGAAHFTLTLKPGEQVELTLSTTEKGNELLRPQNPTLTFVAKTYDDFVVLEQRFQTEKKVEHHRPKPQGPPKPMPL